MVILTKPGRKNETWWSLIKYNKKPDQFIINSMMRRLKDNILFKETQVVQFYNNGKLIESIKV